MGGLYDILESYRDQQNRLNYEGLYEEPADTSINLDPMYNIGARQFGDMRMGMPQATGIMQQAPLMNRFQGVSDMSLIDETTNDEQDQNYIDQVNKKSSLKDSLSSMGRNFGISSLLGMITGNPIIGLLSRGAKGLEGLNNRMQNSDFGRSRTLADYFDARSYGGIDARNRASQRNMREARAIQKQSDMRGDSTSRISDRDRSSVTRSSAAKSKGVGGGGYTASDSNRESYRG